MGNGATSTWNAELVERLAALVTQGRSGTEIALEFQMTRNAIIGKINRLGLVGPRSVGARDPNRPKRQHGGSRQGVNPKTWIKAPNFRKARSFSPRCCDVIPNDVTFEDMTGCRYPSGTGPYLFCDHPLMAGDPSYCEAHHFICWVRPRTWTAEVRAAA